MVEVVRVRLLGSEYPNKAVWTDKKGNTYTWDGEDGSTLTITMASEATVLNADYSLFAAFAEDYDGEGGEEDILVVENFCNGDLGIFLCEEDAGDVINIDPLVLDLNGDGINLIPRESSTAYFDLNQDGIRENVQWIGAQDGFLVFDKNYDGKITGVDELFGNPATVGFEELKLYDTNSDNIIDSNDIKFGQFKVWQDYNQDGIADAGELKTLSELNIESIDLNYNPPANPDDLTIAETSIFTYTDGTQGNIVDVNLEVDFKSTAYDVPDNIPADILALPELKGCGAVKSLSVSMVENNDLKTFVQGQVSTDLASVYKNFDDFLAKWTGADGISEDEMRGVYSARKLAA